MAPLFNMKAIHSLLRINMASLSMEGTVGCFSPTRIPPLRSGRDRERQRMWDFTSITTRHRLTKAIVLLPLYNVEDKDDTLEEDDGPTIKQ